MSKSKSKKSKAKKKSQSRKNRQNPRAKTSKASSSQAKTQTKKTDSTSAKQSIEEKPNTNFAMTIAGVVTCFVLALLIGVWLVQGQEEDEKPAVQGTTFNGQQTIEVKPAQGRPQPVDDYNIQGSSPEGQPAQGGLQKPRTADELQPNAGIEDYENADIIE